MVVTDIGANFGYFSRFLSQQVAPQGKVFAFEPIPQTYKMLLDTIDLNNLKNIYPVQSAVSDTDGSIKIYLSHTHYMASLDVKWASDDGGHMNVDSVTLDSFFEKKGFYPDFIKMDIEGGGVKALKGMVKCITKNEPVLFLESHTAEEDIAIGKALSLIPYDVFRVGSKIPVKYLHKDYTDLYGVYGTVVAIPKSKTHLYPNWAPADFQRKRLGQRL
jgi:FkbM family methyltransferase